MNYIGKFFSNFKEFYNEINAATLTGAIDVIVVRDPRGKLVSSPFHVRFGKLGVLKAREKIVDIEVNDQPVDIHMKLGENGEAFFVRGFDLEEGIECPDYLATSPIPCYGSYLDIPEESEEIRSAHTLKQKHSNETFNSNTLNNSSSDTNVNEKHPSGKNESTTVVSKNDKVKSQTSQEKLVSKKIDQVKESEVQIKKSDNFSKNEETSVKYRKKKRRRSLMKKKNRENAELSQVSQISTDSQTSASQCIFVIDDIDGTNSSESLIKDSNTSEIISTRQQNQEENEWRSMNFGPEHHPFSDTDLSPVTSPAGSRPSTPVKSDTEYEMERQGAGNNDTSRWSWSWGEFPTPPPDSTVQSESAPTGSNNEGKLKKDQGSVSWPVLYWSDDVKSPEIIDKDIGFLDREDQNSMLGGMFSFMRRTKKIRHNPESEGIYLEKLVSEDIDPEVAALYFPNYRGMEISQKDEDIESGNGPSLPHSPNSVEGQINGIQNTDYYYQEKNDILAMNGLEDIAISLCGVNSLVNKEVPTELFLQSLVTFDDFIQNPDVMNSPDLVIRMGGKYYNWSSAAPMIMSLLLYQRPLPKDLTKRIIDNNMPKKKEDIEQKIESKPYSWFMWRRSNISEKVDPKNIKIDGSSGNQETSQSNRVTENNIVNCNATSQNAKSSKAVNEPEIQFEPIRKSLPTVIPKEQPSKCMKSLRLTSEELSTLNLREGANEIVFSVTTAYQGTSKCKCNLYLWNYDTKIIISDIDGTITKSDVLGHLMPYIGNDWAQGGVAQLFSKINDNGYHFLYLSARAIGQAHITREYLRGIKQGNLFLPDGPMLLNPTSLINALHREVIERKPEEFKISCLTDIKALFPVGINPFYAGFGNKINDVIAYRSVGIPISRIFTINHKGELKHDLTETFQSTYSDLSTLVDQVFPPQHSSQEMNEFSSFVFWRSPLPSLAINEIQPPA